jgi:transcriptional regulator with XRE-family HTH domain
LPDFRYDCITGNEGGVIRLKLNTVTVKILIEKKGWSEVLLARKLNLDYSYVYRVMRGERGIGKKFISSLLKFCEKEGLNFRDFILIE